MQDSNKRIYFENLDGLRAIAALSVVFFHIVLWFKFPNIVGFDLFQFILSFGGKGGSLGVNFFFILSGFLITYLMFAEEENTGKLNIGFFYLRRVLRIWPLYYLTIFIGFIIYPLIMQIMDISYTETASSLLYLIFAVNFDHIYNGLPKTGILGVHWSVAIEEQFYLVWPLIFSLLSKNKLFPYILVFIILLSELYFFMAKSSVISYYHLASNFRLLAFGAFLAYLCYRKRKDVILFLNMISRRINVVIYLVCILILIFQQWGFSWLVYYKYLYHFVSIVFFGYVIVEQCFSETSFIKIGTIKFLISLGKISYGLYLNHMIAIYLVLGFFHNNPDYIVAEIICTIALTLIISYFSYYYMESIFLNLKNKFTLVKGKTIT